MHGLRERARDIINASRAHLAAFIFGMMPLRHWTIRSRTHGTCVTAKHLIACYRSVDGERLERLQRR